MTDTSVADAERGAAVYNTWKIHIYDWWVLGFVNSWAWGCPTNSHLLPLMKSNIRSNHLDIGVGTGYYLEHSAIPTSTRLTLCDLSPKALQMAKSRAGRPDTVELLCDITKPLPTKTQFDSISMFFLLHCLPGPLEQKTVVFDHIKHNLTPDGVITGATVLGKGVKDTFIGHYVRRFCENDGIMDNRTDDAATFIESMRKNFDHVEVDVVGVVLVFKLMRPRV